MIVRPRGVLRAGQPSAEVVRTCISENLLALGRLNRLRAYYDGKHDICQRGRSSGLPNNRLVNAFPRYIFTMAAGYLIGNPVDYTTEDDAQRAALDVIRRAYRAGRIDSVDAELARDASIYGKGVELLFADADARPRSAALDPRSAFVVYDDTVESAPLFGVHLVRRTNDRGEVIGARVNVYDRDWTAVYETRDEENLRDDELVDAREHFFGGVPMIEYWNGAEEKGDFECVLSLIDAYDMLQSDRVNDKQQFVDALLLLYGCSLETDQLGRSPGQQLREDKALSLPDCDARAEWLSKQLNEQDTEVLKDALRADIHKMSMVPDLTDAQFAGNSSGVAMRYKLLGLEQLTKIKERWFREALSGRLARYAAFFNRRGAPALDVDKVRMTFTRALPVNELENAQTVNLLRGLVDDEELKRRVGLG